MKNLGILLIALFGTFAFAQAQCDPPTELHFVHISNIDVEVAWTPPLDLTNVVGYNVDLSVNGINVNSIFVPGGNTSQAIIPDPTGQVGTFGSLEVSVTTDCGGYPLPPGWGPLLVSGVIAEDIYQLDQKCNPWEGNQTIGLPESGEFEYYNSDCLCAAWALYKAQNLSTGLTEALKESNPADEFDKSTEFDFTQYLKSIPGCAHVYRRAPPTRSTTGGSGGSSGDKNGVDSRRIADEFKTVIDGSIFIVKGLNGDYLQSSIQIFDINGKILKDFGGQNYVDLSDMNSGIYFFKFKYNDAWHTGKIAK